MLSLTPTGLPARQAPHRSDKLHREARTDGAGVETAVRAAGWDV